MNFDSVAPSRTALFRNQFSQGDGSRTHNTPASKTGGLPTSPHPKSQANWS